MIKYIEEKEGYFSIENDGKTLISIDTNRYDLTLNEDGETYTKTEKDGYVNGKDQETQIFEELEKAKILEGTVEGDAEITRCLQAYSDLCNGVPIETKTQVETQRDDALLDANKWFGYTMDTKGWWE